MRLKTPFNDRVFRMKVIRIVDVVVMAAQYAVYTIAFYRLLEINTFGISIAFCIIYFSSLSSPFSALTNPTMTSISDVSDGMSVAGQTLSTPLLGNLPEHEGDECDADTEYYDEEEVCLVPCSLKSVIDEEELDEVSGDDSTQSSWWNDRCVVWVIFVACVVVYALITWKLEMLLYMCDTGATVTKDLCWSVVNCGTVLCFFCISIIYNQTIKDCKMICAAVLLAPQILVIVFLGDQSVATKATVTMGLCLSLLSYIFVLFVNIAIVYHKTVQDRKLTCWVVVLAPEILTSIILGLVILDQLDAALMFMLGSILCLAILVEAISNRGLIAKSSSAEEDECKQLQDKLDESLYKEGLRLRTSTQIV
jgi:hypothetical protein